jgi:hypothetical protein
LSGLTIQKLYNNLCLLQIITLHIPNKIYRFLLKACQPLAGLSAILFTRLGWVYPPVVWRTGGLFLVKIAALKRNANQSLSVTPMEPFILSFLERLPAVCWAGFPASGVAY